MIALTVSDCLQLTTLRVITALTGSSSTEAPRSPSTRTTSRSDRMPSIRPGCILSLGQRLDRGRKLRLRLEAYDLVTFGVENCTYRHCRLPEADHALERAQSFFILSLQTTVLRHFGCGRSRLRG